MPKVFPSGSIAEVPGRAPGDRPGYRWPRRGAPLGPFGPEEERVDRGRLVVASNRLPLALDRDAKGQWQVTPAAGGLVTALQPAMRRRGGVWLGWAGAPGVTATDLRQALEGCSTSSPCDLEPVKMSEEDLDLYYRGFSNEVLWPFFHGLEDHCRPSSGYLDRYRVVNRRFAKMIASTSGTEDFIWVHDYHLLLVARELRALGIRNRIAFFLHTPFPTPERLLRAPWHREILEALGHFDLIGFQSPDDQERFRTAIDRLGPGKAPNRGSRTGVFPISIDFEAFDSTARSRSVAARAESVRSVAGSAALILGVDRLDYTKGLPHKLRGFRRALREHPELRRNIVLEQLVVPSRDTIGAYQDTKAEIEALVEAINEEWGSADWLPVRYHYGRWSRRELLARYRAADIALVTPLNDGMNLVAKEYCAANGGEGVLILSCHAGAAVELGDVPLLVDPTNEQAVSRAILAAFRMPYGERFKRMAAAREMLRAWDVHRWVAEFLEEGARTR